MVALFGAALGVSWASGRTTVLQELFAPVLGGVAHVTDGFDAMMARLRHFQTLEVDNAALRAEVTQLETALAARDEQARENERLHALLKLKVPAGVTPTAGRVIGRSPDNWHHRLMLDVGSEGGVQIDGVAVTDQGLVGRVVAVSGHTAAVALSTDPTGSVSIINLRTRSAGVMQGQGDAWPILRYMEQPEKWKVGDRLVTSGFGGTFPKGLAVGRVVKLKDERSAMNSSLQPAIFPELRVATYVDLPRLEALMVLPPGLKAMPVPPAPSPKPSPSASPKAR